MALVTGYHNCSTESAQTLHIATNFDHNDERAKLGMLAAKTVLIVVGAGASCFSGDQSVLPTTPPLGNQLFTRLEAFHDVFSRIPEELKPYLRDNFEEGMELLIKEDRTIEHSFLRQLGIYFNRFLLHSDNSFARSNLYVKLLFSLRRQGFAVVGSSLNYESLLEQSALKVGYKRFCHGMPGKWNPKRDFPIIKPHGSANWLPKTTGNARNITFATPSAGGAYVRGIEVERLPPQIASERLVDQRDSLLLPVLSRYAQDKTTLVCPDEIDFQRMQFCKAAYLADYVLIIGVRVHISDIHIWEAISQCDGKIGYVSPVAKEFREWCEEEELEKSHHVHQYFSDCFEDEELSRQMKSFLDL